MESLSWDSCLALLYYKSMKKAAIYNLTWDSLGGGERYAAEFAKVLLDTHQYTVEIWWPENLSNAIKKRFDIDLSAAVFINNPLINKALWQKLWLTKAYDLIFWVSDGSIPILLAKKTIMHFQIPFHSKPALSLVNKIKAQNYLAVCNSYFTKAVIDKTYHINSQVVYPPVDTANFRRKTKENLIVSVGRLSQLLHAKRQDILIEAFRKIHSHMPAWKLVIAGGSQDIDYYHQLVKLSSGLPVKIIANPTLSQIQDLFAKAKIFWSATGFEVNTKLDPEKAEHFGITPVEAMAAGVVPIITAQGGHQETVLPGKTGYLWSTLDELADFTLEMATNYRKWGILSKKSVVRSKIFDREVFAEKFLQLI